MQKHKRTCTVIVFPHEIYCFVAFLLLSLSSLLKLSNIMLSHTWSISKPILANSFVRIPDVFSYCCCVFVTC